MTLIAQSLIPEFVEQAACAQVDPETFFPGKADHTIPDREWAPARAICTGCPVMAECATAAVQAEGRRAITSRFGMWGGLTPAQRHALAETRNARRARKPRPPRPPRPEAQYLTPADTPQAQAHRLDTLAAAITRRNP